MLREKKFYYCRHCKNVVTAIVNGNENIICCGEVMTVLQANTSDASKEKHVPIIKREKGLIKVKVGSTPHPMTDDHYIEWIALAKEDHIQIVWLHPNALPQANFYLNQEVDDVLTVNFSEYEEEVPNCEGAPCNFSTYDKVDEPVVVYAYCNIHGLWKAIL